MAKSNFWAKVRLPFERDGFHSIRVLQIETRIDCEIVVEFVRHFHNGSS